MLLKTLFLNHRVWMTGAALYVLMGGVPGYPFSSVDVLLTREPLVALGIGLAGLLLAWVMTPRASLAKLLCLLYGGLLVCEVVWGFAHDMLVDVADPTLSLVFPGAVLLLRVMALVALVVFHTERLGAKEAVATCIPLVLVVMLVAELQQVVWRIPVWGDQLVYAFQPLLIALLLADLFVFNFFDQEHEPSPEPAANAPDIPGERRTPHALPLWRGVVLLALTALLGAVDVGVPYDGALSSLPLLQLIAVGVALSVVHGFILGGYGVYRLLQVYLLGLAGLSLLILTYETQPFSNITGRLHSLFSLTVLMALVAREKRWRAIGMLVVFAAATVGVSFVDMQDLLVSVAQPPLSPQVIALSTGGLAVLVALALLQRWAQRS
jgi:hypothetical protein